MPMWIQNFVEEQLQVKVNASMAVLGVFLDLESAKVTV